MKRAGDARRSGPRRRGERGANLVEFALLLFPLILMLLGIMEGARYLFVFNQMSDAARAGARYGIVNYSTISNGQDPNVASAAKQAVDSVLASSMLVTATKGTNGSLQYVDVACGFDFRPVTTLLPFTTPISITSRIYKQ